MRRSSRPVNLKTCITPATVLGVVEGGLEKDKGVGELEAAGLASTPTVMKTRDASESSVNL